MNIPSERTLQHICQFFELGEPSAPLITIAGGLLHKLWRLETTTGTYALKLISQVHLQLLKHTVNFPEQVQQIAVFMQQKGIPTVVARQQQGRYLFTIEQDQYLVMPWIEGSVLLAERVPLADLKQIGHWVGAIQRANFKLPIRKRRVLCRWQELIASINVSHPKLVALLERNRDSFIDWGQQSTVAESMLEQQVFSHRDLDPKNIIWQHHQPIILDWEYAGCINPILDIFIVALNWSDVTTGKIDFKRFVTVIEGYQPYWPAVTPAVEIVLAAYKGYCLDWIQFNLQSFPNNPHAETEIKKSLKALQAVEDSQNELGYVLSRSPQTKKE